MLPLIATAIAVKLVLYFLGEDTKQTNTSRFGQPGDFLGAGTATWALTFQTEKHLILQFLHLLVLVH